MTFPSTFKDLTEDVLTHMKWKETFRWKKVAKKSPENYWMK